jgi:hypothetical protein
VKKDIWLVIGAGALIAYLLLRKSTPKNSFDAKKKKTYEMPKFGKETLLINL